MTLLMVARSYGQSDALNVRDISLNSDWRIQTTERAHAGGEQISSEQFKSDSWYPAEVPTTVMAALVKLGEYENIYFDNNLGKISGEPFDVPWWYRREFTLPELRDDQRVRLRFNGINYRADIWLNGQQIASSDTLKGGFRRFTIDVSDRVRPGTNTLALKVAHPEAGDPTVGFVDWNPAPPDHNMGIWREVGLLLSGPVTIEQPFVKTEVDTATLDHAELTVSALVRNHSKQRVRGVLSGVIGTNIRFEQPVDLRSGEARKILFSLAQFKQLGIENPQLWWTHDLGEQPLYDMTLEFRSDGNLSDRVETRFGIRSITDYITKEGHRGFKLNGKKILIRGAGWTDPMLLNPTPDYEEAGIDYAVQANLNTLRFEGFWGNNEHLYNLCDEKGILIMVGWSAEWEWEGYIGTPADEFGGIMNDDQIEVAARSWEDQLVWLRNHPSIFLWLYGSDKLPRPKLERKYLAIHEIYELNEPYVGAAAEANSIYTGPTAMKMRGPYDYVPPVYWYVNDNRGGAFGFNTETGPGPQIAQLESLRKMVPADSLWPISDSWLYHAARNEFHNFNYYNRAINRRLGEPSGLDDYLRKAQYLNYEGMRAMFEAFGSNRYRSTGIIQWMYNSSWPKLWWQLYDYYLLPNGALYGARKANEPFHISYNYGIQSVELMNNLMTPKKSLTADIKMLNFNLEPALERRIRVSELPANQTTKLLKLPETRSLSQTYFLDLRLYDSNGNAISSNFYVLSTRKDRLDDEGSTWFVTPQSQYADLTRLQELPEVELEMDQRFKQQNGNTYATVTLTNPSPHLAFMVHLDLEKGESGDSAVPVFWDDNYVTLLPGERRLITGFCHTRDLEGERPAVRVEGWNIR